MWFTEDAWPPIILLVMIGIGLAFVAQSQQKPRLFVASAFMGILAGMTYFMERAIVTEREKIEFAIHDMARAFQEKDMAGTLNYISPQQTELQIAVTAALSAVTIEDDYRITDVDIETSADNTLAKSHFRANVTVSVIGFLSKSRQPTRWNLDWRKEGDKWRIVEVHQLDPISGQETSQWRKITR